MGKESWIVEEKVPKPYIRVNQLHRGCFRKEAHSHLFWQVILVTDGKLHIKVGSDTTVLCAGSVHILPPGWEHKLISPEGYSQMGIDLGENLHLDADFHLNGGAKSDADIEARDLVRLLEQFFVKPSNLNVEKLLPLAEQISGLQKKGTLFSRAQMTNLLDTLILSCMEAAETASASFEEQLIAYLDANLHCPLRLAEIAEHFYMSVPQLERLCHGSYHCGVIALLKQRRFQKAQQLLVGTELSVREIGSAVGYAEPAHFSAFFRDCAGVSPRTYRQQSRLYA